MSNPRLMRPMNLSIDVVSLPRDCSAAQLCDCTVVVFDVLRATTTMTAALAVGVGEIRIFGSVDDARKAADQFGADRLLCGERACLCPPGFDLGNSPAAFGALHRGKTMFMSTTNGTVALVAAAGAPLVLAGSLVNRSAIARHAAAARRSVTLLCAGTGGAVAMEDLIGAGAVIDALRRQVDVTLVSDVARAAERLFIDARDDLEAVLSATIGGQNVVDAGLAADVTFAAQLDRFDVVGMLERDPLRIVKVAS